MLRHCGHYRWAKLFYNQLNLIDEIKLTPARTHSISGLKSRVLKLALKMMVKSGLEFILKFTKPLQRYLLTCQANSALMGRFFGTGQQQLWRGSVNFKINSRPLFTIIFKLKKGLIILPTARGVLADVWVPDEIDSWIFQQMLLF